MKALILNGFLKGDKDIKIVNKFTEEMLREKGYEVESVLLHEKKISECIGCFGCWIKTPGICVIDDYGRILTENIISSDIVVYLTPVAYGGYSSELKKAIERAIMPLVLPFFKKVNGEVHHKERYDNYPKITVIGMMRDEDNEIEEIFNQLIKRNSLNWYNHFSGGTIQAKEEKGMRNELKNLLKNVEVAKC